MFFVIIFLISRKIPGYALRITPQAIFFARVSANDRRGAQMEFSYEFLIKRLKAFYSAAGLRPAATAAKKRSQYISYRRRRRSAVKRLK